MPVTSQRKQSNGPLIVPEWVAVGCPDEDLGSWIQGLREGAHATKFQIVSRSVPADDLQGSELTTAARDAFVSALQDLPDGPCRTWSFLPRPTATDDETLQRYMRFNAGRTEAYRCLAEKVRVMPAATCVGHAGRDLVVHALWIDGECAAVENPRQRPAQLYSARYGPVPPAFCRGTRTPRMLLASGTASVVGEDTVHVGQLEAQFDETLRNLAALATAGGGDGEWKSLQFYVRDEGDLERVRALAVEHFGEEVERVLHAPICRRELLLEVEGICHAAKP